MSSEVPEILGLTLPRQTASASSRYQTPDRAY